MRVLLTGADGFVGPWVRRELEAHGHTVMAANGPVAAEAPLDLADRSAVAAMVRRLRPDGLLNLAGQSSVAASHGDPAGTFAVNAQGVVNLLAAVKEHSPDTRVVLVGSGEMYGAITPGSLAGEASALAPSSPYASAKVAAEVVAGQFVRSYGMDVVCTRPFNHLGPGQAASFMVPSFARQVLAIKRGDQSHRLLVGNLEPVRDFSHVADVAAGYRLVLEQGLKGQAYNICSGVGVSVRQVLDWLIQLAGVDVEVEVDPARFRPSDAPYLVGDPSRLRQLGWNPSRSVRDTLAEVLSAGAPTASTR